MDTVNSNGLIDQGPVKAADRAAFAITSFILSAVGIFTFLIMLVLSAGDGNDMVIGLIAYLALLLFIISLIFGVLSFRSIRFKGLGIAGVVVSVSTLGVLIIMLIIGLSVS
jgi:hypothetical protein